LLQHIHLLNLLLTPRPTHLFLGMLNTLDIAALASFNSLNRHVAARLKPPHKVLPSAAPLRIGWFQQHCLIPIFIAKSCEWIELNRCSAIADLIEHHQPTALSTMRLIFIRPEFVQLFERA
jgi:hypothetical protein